MLNKKRLLLPLLACCCLAPAAHADVALPLLRSAVERLIAERGEQICLESLSCMGLAPVVVPENWAWEVGDPAFVTDGVIDPTKYDPTTAAPDLLTLDNMTDAIATSMREEYMYQQLGIIPDDGTYPSLAAAAYADGRQRAVDNLLYDDYNKFGETYCWSNGMSNFAKSPLFGLPQTSKGRPAKLNMWDLYPDEVAAGLIDSNYQALSVYLNRHNRFTTFVRTHHWPKIWEGIKKHQAALEDMGKIQAADQPSDPAAWAAEQVPSNTDTLFISRNGYASGYEVFQFLGKLQRKFPDREIIYLTQAFEKNHVATLSNIKNLKGWKENSVKLWTALHEQGFEVIGLGDSDTFAGRLDAPIKPWDAELSEVIYGRYLDNALTNVGNSLEAYRMIFSTWLEAYQQQRLEHPDALIIMDIPDQAAYYTRPFALPNSIQGNNYVVEINVAGEKPHFEYWFPGGRLPDNFVVPSNVAHEAFGVDLRFAVKPVRD